MKIQISRQSGSALVVTLCTIGIIGMSLAAYLEMTATQNRSVARSEAWNSAMVMAETGIEEGVQALYINSTNSTALIGQGWSADGNLFNLSRSFSSGRYAMIISNVNPPVVYSTGYRTTPLGTQELSRTVRATTIANFLFAKGLVAKGSISVGNGNVSSFDSALDGFFVRGVTGVRNNGDTTSLGGDVSVGPNGEIDGRVTVSTGRTISNSGNIGPDGTTGTVVGYVSYTASGTVPNVSLPPGVGPSLGTAIGSKTDFNGATDSGIWYCNGNLPDGITIRNGAKITLYVGGDITFTGSEVMSIDERSSIKILLARNLAIRGNGNINNAGNALNFTLYGLPTCTSLVVAGNGVLNSVIYAPQAAITFDGAGNVGGFSGAAIVNTATFNGNGTGFHYDEQLGKMGPTDGWLISGWDEL